MDNAREEGAPQRSLKNLAGENDTLKERYTASMCCTYSVRDKLDGVRAEWNSAQMEREAFWKEKEILCTSKDEALQSNDRLLSQLEESRAQAMIMETSLKGIQMLEGLRDLVRSSDVGRKLLLCSFSLAM
ncbi:hypothetical protein LIER_05320 [Lithospermum erythrorhizon]|uniref:Uncharacterized protein n=1 Tax=Lithospermum erythrorhizon TaxID=34254 RepID=A0AAV3P4Y6_LITER